MHTAVLEIEQLYVQIRFWQNAANLASSLFASVQALLHAREYPIGPLNVDDPRDLTLKPPLLPARHRLAGPPQSWLTGDWQGSGTTLHFQPGS